MKDLFARNDRPRRRSTSVTPRTGSETRNGEAAAATTTAAETPAGRHVCYIAPAPLVDVMFDQLEVLVSHASRGCEPGCSECSRLERIKALLLTPFHRSAA